MGLGDAGPGGDVDGLFGSILSVVKAVAAPAATFVGGAVGTVIAPGLGTAAGAYLGGKLGGAIRDSGGGGGGGGAPAPSGPAPYTNKTGKNFSAGGPMRSSLGNRPVGYTAKTYKPKPGAKPLNLSALKMLAKAQPKPSMSAGAIIARAAGGLGAAVGRASFAYRGGMR